MAQVLTTGSSLTCDHKGQFTTTSTSKLKVAGKPVLLAAAATGWTANGCIQTGSNVTQCTNIVSLAAGQLTKLRAGGSPLGSGIAGATNGPGTLSAIASQTKLTAT